MKSGKFTGEEIVQDLTQQILDQKLVCGVRLGTSAELCTRYAVSLRTMERVLKKLAERGLVTRTPGRGTFVHTPQSLIPQSRVYLFSYLHTFKIYSSPVFFQAAFNFMNQKLPQLLFEAGYELHQNFVDSKVPPKPQEYQLLFASLDQKDTLIFPAGMLDNFSLLLRSCPAHKILIGDDVPHHGPWHQVIFDYRPGFDRAIQLFQRLRFSKILMVSLQKSETSMHRQRIFREEALLHGYRDADISSYPEFPKLQLTAEDLQHSAADFVDHFIGEKLANLAIFSTSDIGSIALINEFRNRNMLPGKDFQLISYDNFESRLLQSDYHYGITAITHPQDEMLSALLTLLVDLARENKKEEFYRTYWVPAHELVERDTTM